MKEAPCSSETSVLTRATRRNNPEDTILHTPRNTAEDSTFTCRCCDNLECVNLIVTRHHLERRILCCGFVDATVTDITCDAEVLSGRREFRVGQSQGAPEHLSLSLSLSLPLPPSLPPSPSPTPHPAALFTQSLHVPAVRVQRQVFPARSCGPRSALKTWKSIAVKSKFKEIRFLGGD
jgi:hypothetical protein